MNVRIGINMEDNENKLIRIKELEEKGVYNLSKEELDELDTLVKEQISLFSKNFEVAVEKACEGVRGIMNFSLRADILNNLNKHFFIKREDNTIIITKVFCGTLRSVSYSIDTLINMCYNFGMRKIIKIINEELENQ